MRIYSIHKIKLLRLSVYTTLINVQCQLKDTDNKKYQCAHRNNQPYIAQPPSSFKMGTNEP